MSRAEPEQERPLAFRPRFLLLRWAFAIFWLGLALDSVLGFSRRSLVPDNWLDTALAFAGFSAVGLIFAWAAAVERILIYPDRLEYQSAGFRISAAWADVQGILQPWPAAQGRRWNLDRLVVRRADIHAPALVRLCLQLLGSDHVIAIGSFDPLWRESGLGEAIRQYAPNLDG